MCPVCIATAAAVIAAKTTSTGGAAALVVKRFRKKDEAKPVIREQVEIEERKGAQDGTENCVVQ